MKRLKIFLYLGLVFLAYPSWMEARHIPPIVSTQWLNARIGDPSLTILDVRRVEAYQEGHIPGAINVYAGAWAYKKGVLFNEIPDQAELNETIGAVGISLSSAVVVVGNMDTVREGYQTIRVACTLLYAGLEDVAVLDGGMNKWVKENRPLSQKVVKPIPREFQGRYRTDLFADKAYVKENLGKIILVDVREPAYYSGEKKLDCVARPGHIPGAYNLPTSCAFNSDGTFKTKEELLVIAESVTGAGRDREIITYCDTGQCCPTWHFIMRELLGFPRVRIYDGSMQEWGADERAPVTK
ncbi:MAG TPA: sulfurtransferase [Syntrophales bacterium]|nr:sulfurtransferase [Syntrophales bacterium]HOL58313.1 sulfurtransferase [Syntrophales bacterium]HPO34482.1 sulfurtransferase [Syntrophales bacterium]